MMGSSKTSQSKINILKLVYGTQPLVMDKYINMPHVQVLKFLLMKQSKLLIEFNVFATRAQFSKKFKNFPTDTVVLFYNFKNS